VAAHYGAHTSPVYDDYSYGNNAFHGSLKKKTGKPLKLLP
jgi:hypothetical protein